MRGSIGTPTSVYMNSYQYRLKNRTINANKKRLAKKCHKCKYCQEGYCLSLKSWCSQAVKICKDVTPPEDRGLKKADVPIKVKGIKRKRKKPTKSYPQKPRNRKTEEKRVDMLAWIDDKG